LCPGHAVRFHLLQVDAAILKLHSRRVCCLAVPASSDSHVLSGDKKGGVAVWNFMQVEPPPPRPACIARVVPAGWCRRLLIDWEGEGGEGSRGLRWWWLGGFVVEVQVRPDLHHEARTMTHWRLGLCMIVM
jgi:hypothetical protein